MGQIGTKAFISIPGGERTRNDLWAFTVMDRPSECGLQHLQPSAFSLYAHLSPGAAHKHSTSRANSN